MPKSVPLWWSNPSAILRYTVSVLSVAAAVVAGLLLDTQLNTAPFVSLFVCAIMFATWFGGVRPGLLATALSILAFDYYFVPPTHSLLVDGEEALRLVLFAITALFVFSFVAAQKSAADSLRRTAMTCEQRFTISKESTRRCKPKTRSESGPNNRFAKPNERSR